MSDNSDLPDKITLETPNFQTELAAQIAEIVPEVISDGKLDVTKLRDLINGDEETSHEKFGLFWPGKQRAQAVAQLPTTATLKPAPEESVDWGTTKNIFIEGDNLEVLKVLQDSYRKKIKMIYIDPPYNTGKEFIYPDNFQEGLRTYLEYTGQKNEGGETTESKKETGGRKHSNWLSMMYPRLQVAKSLLTDDGVIFISIDDNEQSNLRRLCDEVFGEDNFVAQFVWHSSTGGGLRSKYVNASHQYVLCYVRDTDKSDMFWAPLSDEAIQQYKQKDEKGLYRDKDFAWKNSSAGVNQKYPISAPDGEVILPKEGYIYRFIQSRFETEMANGSVTFKKSSTGPFVKEDGSQANWNIYIKKYLSDGKGAPTSLLPRSLVGINNEGTTEVQNILGGRYFESPKNVRLLEYFLHMGSDKNSIILDFFSGSGSTAHAVMQLNAEDGGNRQHIQVQLPELTDDKSEAYKAGYKTISDISKERIRRAGKKVNEDFKNDLTKRPSPLDTGFRVYKLSSSNFMEWDEEKASKNPTQAVLDFAKNRKVDSTPEELLTEIMLRSRITLETKVEKKTLTNGGWVYVVNDGSLIAYVLDDQLTVEQATEIADMSPAQFVAIDAAFNDNDALKINIANICREKHVGVFKTI